MMDRERYQRQLVLPGFGEEGQEKLSKSKVLIVGAGGLGIPAALYLAGAGVGEITIVDSDRVHISNLHRQPVYTVSDIGKSKAEVLGNHLRKLNPGILIQNFSDRFVANNSRDLISKSDLVMDCSDNFPTRYLINDECIVIDKPFISAAVYRYEGQLGVFNYQGGPTYRCFAPNPPGDRNFNSCSELGVLGTVPAIMGVLQANEAIKILIGSNDVINNKILLFSTLNSTTSFYTLSRNSTAIESLKTEISIDKQGEKLDVDFDELDKLFAGRKVIFTDVRERDEEPYFDSAEILRLPMSGNMTVPIEYADDVLICFCQAGIRSIEAARRLRNKGYAAFSLNRGIGSLLSNPAFNEIISSK